MLARRIVVAVPKIKGSSSPRPKKPRVRDKKLGNYLKHNSLYKSLCTTTVAQPFCITTLLLRAFS